MKRITLFSLIVLIGLSAFAEPPLQYLEWADVHKMCDKITDLCKEKKKKWKGILTVTRGGLLPSTFLAERLGIKNIRTICLSSYTPEMTRGPIRELYRPADIDNGGEGWIVVDDLVDSGETLKYVRQIYPKAFYLTLMAKPQGKPQVDAYATECPQETFIVFPWENEHKNAQLRSA